MKKILGAALFTLIVASASHTIAAEEVKIGYVDLQEALNSSDSGKKAKEVFKGEVDRLQRILKRQEEELKSMKDELEKQALLLSTDVRRNREREYQETLKKFQRFYQDSQEDLKSKDAQLTKMILIDLRDVILKMGEEEGYTIILEKNESSILYAPKTVDLTSEVIKRLNEGRK